MVNVKGVITSLQLNNRHVIALNSVTPTDYEEKQELVGFLAWLLDSLTVAETAEDFHFITQSIIPAPPSILSIF